MDRATWERIQDLFHRAREIPPAERGSFLASECADPAIARRVREMLAADEADATPILDAPLGAVAERLLDGQAPPGAPNQRFGPYTVRRLLGEGGMGTVFLAVRDDLESEAALKILRDASLSPSRRERFQAEQRALAQLHHPSIAQLYDAGTLPDGTPWFVMEYVEGVPLTEYCRRRETSLRGRLLLFRAVTDAVRHAHRHAIVHRDLKPSNVLVKDDGSVRLLDFGIAKQLEGDEPADQTRTGLRLMTPAYAAPEQLTGGAITTATDVYALGVLLYQLLTGRHPSVDEATTPASLVQAVLYEEPARASEIVTRGPSGDGPTPEALAWARGATPDRLAARLAGDLDTILAKAMKKAPAERYASVAAFEDDCGGGCGTSRSPHGPIRSGTASASSRAATGRRSRSPRWPSWRCWPAWPARSRRPAAPRRRPRAPTSRPRKQRPSGTSPAASSPGPRPSTTSTRSSSPMRRRSARPSRPGSCWNAPSASWAARATTARKRAPTR